jgi:dTDP-D-glucose 4,6-dehydratase
MQADRRNLDGLDVRLVEGDIGHLELVERIPAEEEIEVVVNFAAESHNRRRWWVTSWYS